MKENYKSTTSRRKTWKEHRESSKEKKRNNEVEDKIADLFEILKGDEKLRPKIEKMQLNTNTKRMTKDE